MHKSFTQLKPIFFRRTAASEIASPLTLCLLITGKKVFVSLTLSFLSLSVHAEMLQTDDPALLKAAQNAPFGWLKREQLPLSLQKDIPPGCNGIYIESSTAHDANTSALDTLDLVVESNDASILDGNKATLEGDVVVSQGNRSISAGKMTYDREDDRATLEKSVTIRQPGMLIQGEYAEVSTTEHKASFNEATFVLKEQQVRGGARSVKQLSASKLELNEGHITSCEPGDEAWVLEGEQITVNSETNQGTGKNVKLKIGSVPVFYLPYITFPVGDERQTGFLFPSISSSDDGGLDIATPYYWNLAPNYDATLTPRFISSRGTMLEFETRYLNEWIYTDTGIAFLPDDGGSEDKDLDKLIEDGEITEEEARPHKGSSRWLLQFEQQSSETKGWYTRADYTRVSDEDYFRDLGTSSLSVSNKTFLEQALEIGYQFEHWKLSSLAQTQQVLLLDIDAPYRKLPQIDIDGRYNFNDWILSVDNRFTQFKHRENRADIITGKRFNTDYRLRWEKRFPWGFFTPEIGHKSLHYSLSENPLITDDAERQFRLSTPQASIDLGLVFEHTGGAYTQTVEPRAYYLYRRYTDHSDLFSLGGLDGFDVNFDTSERTFAYGQLYRDSRFIGNDRLDDADQVTLGLTTRWVNNTTGRELFSASVGQIFHFRDRNVSLFDSMSDSETAENSEFAGELNINLGPRTQLFSNTIYDTETERVNRGSAGVYFSSDNAQKLFNISYSYLRDLNASDEDDVASKDIDQLDLSFAYPAGGQWALMGRVNYDFQNDQELETFLGFEYNDCCYRFRILARRWLDSNIANLVVNKDAQYDQGIFFEVHFKGLGGSGAKVNSILNDGIFGYESREQNLR
ncbi:MAG: LPS-assembly protein LptD [Agarilytica sp.]